MSHLLKIPENEIPTEEVGTLEHSKTHSPDGIHPTHRQDIGKVS